MKPKPYTLIILTVMLLPCRLWGQAPAVVDLNAAATMNAALLTWNYWIEPQCYYEVVYDSVGGTNPVTMTTSETYCAIYNLSPRTIYKAFVRAGSATTGFGNCDSVLFSTGPFNIIALDSGTTTNWHVPLSNTNRYSYTQQLITAAEMGGVSTVVTGIDFEYAYTEPITYRNNVTIYLTNTSDTTLENSFVPFDTGTFKVVYTGSLNATYGWNHYAFDTPFNYDGNSNLLITVLDNSGAGSTTYHVFKAHHAPGKSRYYNNSTADNNLQPLTPTSIAASMGSVINYRSNMRLRVVDQDIAVCASPEVAVVGGNSDSTVLMWVPGFTENSWDVAYRMAGATAWTTVGTGVITPPFTITNLVSNTEYEFRVSHQCDDTTYSSETVFTTPCSQKTIPYTENFENVDGNMPDCWSFMRTGNAHFMIPQYDPMVRQDHSHSGIRDLTLDGLCYIMLPEMAEPLEGLQITFYDYIMLVEGGTDNKLVVGVMDPCGFIPIDTATLIPDRYSRVNVMFNNYHGSSRTIALRNYNTMGENRCRQYIDDISVDHLPSCLPVRNVYTTYISDNSIGIAWTPNGNESTWVVTVGDSTYTVSTNSILLSNLSPSTYYTINVRALCSSEDTSAAVSHIIRTDCGRLTALPYIQNFEHEALTTDTTFIPCWNILTAGNRPNIIEGFNNTAGGYKCLAWPISTATNYCIVMLPELDTQAITANSLKLSLKINSRSFGRQFYVGVMGNPDSVNSFVPYDTITIQHTAGYYNWIPYIAVIHNWNASGTHIAIRANSANGDWSAYFDDIVLEVLPPCPAIENINVITTYASAIVIWTPFDNSYRGALVEYKESDAATWNTQTVTGISYATITGLTPNTHYDLRVTALCDGEDGASVSSTFFTPNLECAEIDPTTREDVTIGTGDSLKSGVPVDNGHGNTLCQSIYLASELSSLDTSTTIQAVTYTWTNNANFAKKFSIYMTNTQVSDFATPTADCWVPTGQTSLVYSGPHPIGTSGSVTYQLNPPFVWDGTNNICITTTMNQPDGITQSSSNFYGLSTQTSPSAYRSMYRRVNYNQQNGANPSSVTPTSRSYYRPNITLTSGSCLRYDSCAAPAAIITDITSNSASIVWVPGYAESEWTLSIRSERDSTFTVVTTGVTGNTYTFNGLSSGTAYEFMITSNCDDRFFVVSDTTPCSVISSLPFFEDFNNWGSGYNVATDTYVIPRCWNSFGNVYIQDYSYSADIIIRNYLSMYQNQTANSTIILPPLDTNIYQINQTQLVFHSWAGTAPSIFVVGVMTDPTDANSFVPVDTVQSIENSSWEPIEVPLDTYNGDGTYVAIRTIYNNSNYNHIDDLTLELIPPCQTPDSLYSTGATNNSVVIGWHDRAGASQWQVEYGPEGFAPGTGTIVTANSNPFTLTGLPSSYRGDFYVRAVCDSVGAGPLSRRGCLFNTHQIPATIPYNYGFEEASEWANWESVSNKTTDWLRGSAVVDSGSYSLYLSADSGATYKPYSYNEWVNAAVYRDIDFGSDTNNFFMTFRTRAGGDLVVMFVDPDTMPLPNRDNYHRSRSPWGNVDSLHRLVTVHRDSNWTTYEIDIDTISGIHRLVFFWYNTRRGGNPSMSYEPAAVDNIHIYNVTCPRPLWIDTLAVTGNTATLTWDGDSATSYQVDYCYAGGTRNTVMSTTDSITLTDLSPTSVYQVWVRKICSAGDTSRWSDSLEFTTKICDGGLVASIGDPINADGTTNLAPVNNHHKYSLCEIIIDSAEIGGPMYITAIAFYLDFDIMPMTWKTDVTIWLQPTDMTQFAAVDSITTVDPTTAVQVFHGLFYCVQGWNYFYFDSVYSYNGHGNLMVIIDDNSGVSFGYSIIFKTKSCGARKTAVFGNYYSDVDPTSAAINIDEAISYMWRPIMQLVNCPGDCLPPTVSSISTGYTNATLNVVGQGSSFELSYGPSISSQPNVLTSTTGVFNISGLTPGTTYHYSVRQECDSGEYSSYNQSLFTTQTINCPHVRNLLIDSTYYDGATFSWNAGNSESAWEVQVYNYVSSISDTTTTSRYTIRGLYSNTQYYFNVRPLCGPDADIAGDWIDSSILFTTDICQPVSNLHYVGRTGTSITLAWDAAIGTDTWSVAYGYPDFSHGEELGSFITTDNPVMLDSLDTATAYTVQVATQCTEELVSTWTQLDFITTDGEGIVTVDTAGNITLYPNPASTTATLTVGEQWIGSSISITDINGRMVAHFEIHNSQFNIDLSMLRTGAYFVRFTSEQSTALRKLIVK